MTRRKYSLWALVLLAFFLTQCQKPADVLGKKEMSQVTKELLVTEAYTQNSSLPDSISERYYDAVFAQRGISKEKYVRSLKWYAANGHRLADIYTQIESEVSEVKALTDTFLTDSIHRYRLRHQPIKSLWTTNDRLYIPTSQMVWSYTQGLGNIEELKPGISLVWEATIFDQYNGKVEGKIELLVADSDTKSKEKVVSAPLSYTPPLISGEILIQDSLPKNRQLTLLMLLHKDSEPLLLDRITFQIKEQEIESEGSGDVLEESMELEERE